MGMKILENCILVCENVSIWNQRYKLHVYLKYQFENYVIFTARKYVLRFIRVFLLYIATYSKNSSKMNS